MLSYQLILAAEEVVDTNDVILPAPAELVYGAISFAIVYVILAKFAFPKMTEALENRAAAIQGKMEQADAALEQAKATEADYQAKIADAKGEANRIIEEAKSTAEALRRDIVAKAEAEASNIVARAQQEVTAERDRALQELRGEVSQLSVQLASKIVEKEIDASTHAELVNSYIDRLASNN